MCELFGLSSNRPVQAGELTEGPGWLAFEPGELRVYRAGREVAQFITHPRTMAPVPDGDLPRTKTIVSDNGRPTPLKNGASP